MIVMFNLSFRIVNFCILPYLYKCVPACTVYWAATGTVRQEPVVGVEAGVGQIKLSSYVVEPAAYPVMDAALISAALLWKASIVDFFISIPLFIVEY